MGLFLVKKWEIQVIMSMIMLTRSSERIFNPNHYTGSTECFSFQIKVVSFSLLHNYNERIYNERFYFDLNRKTFNIKHSSLCLCTHGMYSFGYDSSWYSLILHIICLLLTCIVIKDYFSYFESIIWNIVSSL